MGAGNSSRPGWYPHAGVPPPPLAGEGSLGYGVHFEVKERRRFAPGKNEQKITKTMPLGGTTGSFGVPPRVRQTHSPSPPPLRGPTLKNPQVGGRTPFLPLCAKPTPTFIPCLFLGGGSVWKSRESDGLKLQMKSVMSGKGRRECEDGRRDTHKDGVASIRGKTQSTCSRKLLRIGHFSGDP